MIKGFTTLLAWVAATCMLASAGPDPAATPATPNFVPGQEYADSARMFQMIPMAAFTEDDVMAGKSSAKARLRALVNQATGKAPVVIYNGIELPAVWPPRDGNPMSTEPMRVPYLEYPPKVIPIAIGRQLFVDNFLIERSDLTRSFHQAQKLASNPVMVPVETDGEGLLRACRLQTGGVFYDPSDRVFKMFYDAGFAGALGLAISTDLLHWSRPNVGGIGGNLLLPRGHGKEGAGRERTVWLDLNAQNPNERLKLMSDRFDPTLGNGETPENMYHTLQTSADGRVWSPIVRTGPAEDYSSFFYNPFRTVWVFSLKAPPGVPRRDRCRYYAEGSDFLGGADWAKSMVYWTNADRLDEPDPKIGDAAQLYCLNAVAYESLLLGEFQIHLGPDNRICEKGRFPKLTELKLGFSRDGFHWARPDRAPFIAATRKEGAWDRAWLHGTAGVCLVMGDRLWFPYTGHSGVAPDGMRGQHWGGSIGMATLRRDGFASMDAGEKTGMLTTRPLAFKGGFLFVNLDAPRGELRAEVLDGDGNVIAPFSAENCVTLRCDQTSQRVVWRDADSLAPLSGRPVRLRFILRNGSFYSFWVTPDANGASHGYVAAGGPGFDGVVDTCGAQALQLAR